MKEIKAGLNWVLVKDIRQIQKEKFELQTTSKPFWATVVSVGACEEKLFDPSLTKGSEVLLEPTSRGIEVDENLTAFRRTQIVTIK